jgi:hypothetical protein
MPGPREARVDLGPSSRGRPAASAPEGSAGGKAPGGDGQSGVTPIVANFPDPGIESGP